MTVVHIGMENKKGSGHLLAWLTTQATTSKNNQPLTTWQLQQNKHTKNEIKILSGLNTTTVPPNPPPLLVPLA